MNSEVREEVLKLMQQKDKIEDEIKELTSILTKNGVGMADPLVDAAGFPISSIDVYQVRHARHRIICLQNDHKAIMKDIENGLHGYYSSSATTNGSAHASELQMQQEKVNAVIHKEPFARVSVVSPQSPAEYAGMQVDDFVVEFGSLNSSNFRNMQDIAAIVQHSEGQQVSVKLKRGERYIVTYLIPKKWTGRGLLGCNIMPL